MCVCRQVVRHSRYGYRGVIYGWDLRPTLDVARWDGVVGLPRAGDQPFYHLLPDAHDSAAAFGSPREVWGGRLSPPSFQCTEDDSFARPF